MKLLLLITGFWLLIPAGFSQSFILSDDYGRLNNGDELFQSGSSDTLQLITNLHITNPTAGTLSILMKKQDISLLPGGNASICWAGYCYSSEMLVSTFPLLMLPGDTVSGCFGHFGPQGSRGENIVRWVFFNEANPADSVSVTVHYFTYPASVKPTGTSDFSLKVCGTFSASQELMMQYSIGQGNIACLELRDLSGKVVSASESLSQSETWSVHTGSLPGGIYLCAMMVRKQAVIVKKVIVRH